LAVSGGLDSIVLCELAKQAGLDFFIAHCNFQLRGEESERDEAFVKSLRDKYEVEVFTKKFDTLAMAEQQRISIQEAARNLRYEWFEELIQTSGLSHTLLAHHADDNIETLMMNFFRGSGLEGLTGMNIASPKGRGLRPMLSFRREEIKEFAVQHELEWVEDSSNVSSKYTRNYFRNELIPQLKKIYPNVEENLLNTIERINRTNDLYKPLVEDLKKKICRYEGDELRIPVKQLMTYANTSLIYEIIKDFGFGEKQVREVLKLADSESGKYIDSTDFRIIRHRNWFIIVKKKPGGRTLAISEEDREVIFEDGIINIKQSPALKVKITDDPDTALLDAREIRFPLILRKWKAGDYFYPLGMRKKKKLSRFFIDQKLSRNKKENMWVIESDKRIIWVVGMRIDDRFRIKDSSNSVLLITKR
jgi:tRNA(Ile)-lysidine synthase